MAGSNSAVFGACIQTRRSIDVFPAQIVIVAEDGRLTVSSFAGLLKLENGTKSRRLFLNNRYFGGFGKPAAPLSNLPCVNPGSSPSHGTGWPLLSAAWASA
jgi:hypothetical protein